jgi:predicted ester cyclase
MDTERSVDLVLRFWREVWSPPYNIDVIDDLLTDDFVLVNAGVPIHSRSSFKEFVRAFGRRLGDARLTPEDTFANVDGTKVVTRWRATGKNNGMFGLPPNGEPVEFTGISIWEIRDDKLAAHWIERSAFELYQKLITK